MPNLTLRNIGQMLLKELPSGEDTPEQKSVAQELLRYANISPVDKPQFQRKVPAWLLLGMAEKSQPVRTCIDAIVRECTRSTQYYDRCWAFYPKDADATYEEESPERQEYKAYEELLMNPDRRNRRSFNQILSAALYDLLVFDDAFISIAFENADVMNGKPVALYNEESDGMEIRTDKRGNIGDGTWFCDQCEPDREYKENEAPSHTCPKHGIPMRQTAYVQSFGGKVRARWSKEEMLHIHMFRAGGRGYGSPPLMSLFFAVSNLMAMDQYFSDAYALQRTPRGFVVFTGVDQTSVSQSAIQAEEAVNSNPMSVPWFAIPEGKSVEFISLMTAPKDMQSTEFYKTYTEMVYKTFHVTPIVAGTVESGKSGNNPSIQLDVQADFIRAYQRALSEAFANSILPERFQCTKWYFGFTPIEQEEEKAEADTQLAWATVAKAWEDARFDVALDEDGKPYPVGQTPKEPLPPVTYGLPPPPSEQLGGAAPKTEQTQPKPQPPEAPAQEAAQPQAVSPKGKAAEWYGAMMKAAPKPSHNEDWVSGLRSTELDFYRGLDARYKAAVDEAVGEIKSLKNPTESQVKSIIDKALGRMENDLVAQAKASLGKAYDTSFTDAMGELGLAETMTGKDEAALAWMEQSWSGVESVLPEFVSDQKAVFTDLIKQAYGEVSGLSTYDLVDKMREVSTAETWKLARIVRSEITLISNNARASAWKQADEKGLFKYDWSNVDDSCDICGNISAGNPYSYDDLAEESRGGDGQPFRPHPFCRCTVIRHVLEK